MSPHEGLDGLEVALGQVFETPLTVQQSVVHAGERSDGLHEVAIVVHDFQLDRTQEGWITGQLGGGFGLVSPRIHERLKAETFQPLGHCAAIPSQSLGRGLHVEALLTQLLQDGEVTRGIRQERGGAGWPDGPRRGTGQAKIRCGENGTV